MLLKARWKFTTTEVSTRYFDKGCKCVFAYYKHKFYHIVENIGYLGDKYYTAAVMDTHPTLHKPAWYSPNKVFYSFDDGIYYHENYVFV